MKKTVFILGIIIFIGSITLIGCLSSDEKVTAARENVEDTNKNVEIANRELNQAINDSIIAFRKDAEERISLNKKTIADFKLKIANERKEVKAKNEQKLAELEARNNQMEKTLLDYKEEGENKWVDFKIKFNRDLDDLGKAFSNLSNKK